MVKVLITGRPGVGKSTVFLRVVEESTSRGIRVCGFYCPEVRVRGVRKGFRIVSIGLPLEGVLAYVCGEMEGLSGITVGKYCVKLDDAVAVGVRSLDYALRECDVVAVDEVGPMELRAGELGRRIWDALLSPKPVLAVVHRSIAEDVRSRLAARSFRTYLYVVTELNRSRVHEEVLRTLLTG